MERKLEECQAVVGRLLSGLCSHDRISTMRHGRILGKHTMLKQVTVKIVLVGAFIISTLVISGCAGTQTASPRLTERPTHERHEVGLNSHTADRR